MRITTLMTRDRRLAEIQQREQQLEETRQRVSTGQRIQNPSDDPGAIGELLRVHSQVEQMTQRQNNIDAALPAMKASEAALGDISTALRSAQTLALQARNGTVSDDQRQVLADQLHQINARIHDLANTRVGGSYVFAGSANDAQPFTAGPP